MNARLEKARADLERERARLERARAQSEAATPGGLSGYDPAVLSGIRRKRNAKADAQRYAAYDREAAAAVALVEAERRVKVLEEGIHRAERDAATKALVTAEALAAATHVRTRSGWFEVVRVSAKTVTVDAGWLGVMRVQHAQILEVKTIQKGEQDD